MKTNRYVAEIFGTFALVFAGCGAIIVNDIHAGALGNVGISLVFGLVIMAMIYAVGNVSGAHLNPAVTLTFALAGRFEKREILPYISSQFIGALLAALILRVLFPAHSTLGATLPNDGVLNAFVMEVVLSFFLMFVIFNVSTGHMEKGIMAGVAIGGTVALDAMFGGPVCGASMNPMRSLAPALVSGHLASLWIYLVAPVAGMFLSYPVCRLIQGRKAAA